MTKFLDFISSKKFRNVFCFIAFTFLMAITISSQNYFFQNIIENGVCKKDVIAQKDIVVIDTKKTELRKKEAAQNVEPILAREKDVEDSMFKDLTILKNSVRRIRGKNIDNDTKSDELKVLFSEPEYQNLIDFLLKSGDNELDSLFDKSKNTLSYVLNIGITAKDFDNNNVSSIIHKQIPTNVPKYQTNYIEGILNQVIVPNIIVNEFATGIARANAESTVKPYEVVFKKGQTIISKDDILGKNDQLIRDTLRAAGYNVVEINFIGILSFWVLISFFTYTFLFYQKNFEKQYYNAKYLGITATFTFIIALLSALIPIDFLQFTNLPMREKLYSLVITPFIIPFPAYTLLLSIFMTPRSAFFCSTITLALISVGMHWSIEVIISFVLLSTVVMTAISNLKFSKRTDLLIVSSKITIAGVLIVGTVYFLGKYLMDIDNGMIIRDLFSIIINCFVFGGIVLLGILPLIEILFKVYTPYGLAELADHNQPLLKKLMQDAPGTFNHSLTISHMCENAAEAIGANPVLARVGAMYHDIGKILRPMFFVENQSFYGIENPHNSCTPRFSKMLITAHPKDGVELAKEARLPQVIQNFILQHHGTSLVSYFYNEALKEEGEENVKEEQFRYPGPKPNMKETAILMIADAVESAVRAAKNPSNEEIDAIINKIIKERLNDGQLEDSPLTLKDLKTIGETFSRMLRGMHHKRIKYHNDLVHELDKNKQVHESSAQKSVNIDIINSSLDAEMSAKIQELEKKKNADD